MFKFVTHSMKKIRPHIEWIAFLTGLVLMATMNPYETGKTFCLIERAGIPYCSGHGLGHSIAFLFRGEFQKSINSNLFGIFAVLILGFRIVSIWLNLFKTKTEIYIYGESDVKNY